MNNNSQLSPCGIVFTAQSLGIAAGDDKGNFRPEEFISRVKLKTQTGGLMTVKQISVFVENKAGKLAELTEYLHEQEIDMRALSISPVLGLITSAIK